ncbi:MAG TPA: TonB-dependent receptor [Vicinamibacterales bacterium]|nr:TonB-dependent receptor [Vicinamibacterales bacterium]
MGPLPIRRRPPRLCLVAILCAFALSAVPARAAGAQQRGVVVDQTGLPLPGAHIDIRRDGAVVASLDTGMDGGFNLPETRPDDVLEISLDGFETAHVKPADAARVVLLLARATATTEVVASTLTSAGAAMEHLGSTMTAPLAQRLPTARPRILQSLPLLPAVVRGRDGLLRIGGTRPHESSLWIDGFDVTDPVSGTTAIDLPVEAVRGMAVLREPVSAAFGHMLGSAASIETTPGSDKLKAGVQGFIPRPRLSRLGLGQIEAFFPRAYVGGRLGIARFFASAEFNFERVPVPDVTGTSGRPNVGTTGVTSFARFDLQPSTRHTITAETLFAPAHTTSSGLSTLRPEGTVPDVDVRDVFGAVTDRLVLSPRDLLTIRAGMIRHDSTLAASGSGDAVLTPEGWQQNWFSMVDLYGVRQSVSALWEHAGVVAAGSHTFSINGGVYHRSMDGTLSNQTIRITDSAGALVRRIEFGVAGRLNPAETYEGLGFRDLWDVNRRLQIDLGLRLDGGASTDRVAPGPRIGVRYLLDEAGRTTIRGSAGRFVGRVPLGAEAFRQFPARLDTTFDPTTGRPVRSVVFQPAVDPLPLPRADAIAIEIEHRLRPDLELQAALRRRVSFDLPTVFVPADGGVTPLEGNGRSDYRELQLSLRRTWANGSQLFVSYVRSSSTGETNDFGTLFTNLDTPLLEPGAQAPTPAAVPHRLRGWATFSLPRLIVISPAVEWRTGFPFSALDVYQHYAEPPNQERYPAYFSADLTAFKTFDLFGRKMDLGLQFFNLTGHANPRDVIAVVGSPRYHEFSSTFRLTLAGYMQVRWQ